MMETRNMTHNSLRHTRYYLFLVRRIDYNDVDDNFMSMNEFWWHALLWIMLTEFAMNYVDGSRWHKSLRMSPTSQAWHQNILCPRKIMVLGTWTNWTNSPFGLSLIGPVVWIYGNHFFNLVSYSFRLDRFVTAICVPSYLVRYDQYMIYII